MFDWRFEVYEEVWKFASEIAREASISIEELRRFYGNVTQVDFLFGKEIRIYIDEIHEHALNLYTQIALDHSDPNKDSNKISRELHWFFEQASNKTK